MFQTRERKTLPSKCRGASVRTAQFLHQDFWWRGEFQDSPGCRNFFGGVIPRSPRPWNFSRRSTAGAPRWGNFNFFPRGNFQEFPGPPWKMGGGGLSSPGPLANRGGSEGIPKKDLKRETQINLGYTSPGRLRRQLVL
jgi:hypothetical protein